MYSEPSVAPDGSLFLSVIISVAHIKHEGYNIRNGTNSAKNTDQKIKSNMYRLPPRKISRESYTRTPIPLSRDYRRPSFYRHHLQGGGVCHPMNSIANGEFPYKYHNT